MRLVVNGPSRAQGELTIGIVGPHDLVERIMLSGTSAGEVRWLLGRRGVMEGGPARRLVAAAYRDEQEAADQVVRLGTAIDVCLFASRVPYEYARTAGVLTLPGDVRHARRQRPVRGAAEGQPGQRGPAIQPGPASTC